MNPHNRPIVEAFTQIADLLELQSADPVRIRAYRKASRVLSGLPLSVRAMLHRGDDLRSVDGIGEGLAGSVSEIAQNGSCTVLERLHAEVPQDLTALMQLAHLGPQRVRTLHEELGVRTIEQLHAAALAGRLQTLAGFGPRLEGQLLKVTTERLSRLQRYRVDVVVPAAQALLAWVALLPGVIRTEPAGALRRRCDCVAQIDLMAQSEFDREVVAAFANHPEAREVPFSGRSRVGVLMASGLRVNLQVAAASHFGAAWLAATGSGPHLRALGRIAQKRRMTLDENGLARHGSPPLAATEEEIYEHLDLAWMPPELREDRGELAAAAAGTLPRLVEPADLRGDLQVQARNGGAEQDLLVLMRGAHERGLAYIAVCDHVRRINTSRSNDLDRLARQVEIIDRLNAQQEDVAILKGAHVDILEDGRLNVPDAILERLDLVVATLGHPYDLPRGRQTERVLRAMDNRFFSVLGSPTGRLIEERRPIAMDLVRVLRKARERGCFVELDSRPAHLDLDDNACRLAKEIGVLVCIDSWAHDAAAFDHLRHGVGQARRGWLEKADVLNTRPVDEVRALLRPTMAG